MWQKARQTKCPDTRYSMLDGKTFWVMARPPDECGNFHLTANGNLAIPIGPMYETNVMHPTSQESMGVYAAMVELLPEFAEDVPLIPWEEFIR